MIRLGSLLALDARLLAGRPLFRAALVLAALLGGSAAASAEGSAYVRLARGLSVLLPLTAAFGALLGAASLPGDLQSGALRAVLLRPLPRTAIALSRAFWLVVAQAAIVLAGGLAAYLAAKSSAPFGAVLHGEGIEAVQLLSAAEVSEFASRAVVLALPGLLAAPLIGFAVGAFLDDPAAAALTALALVLGPILAGAVADMSFPFAPSAAGAEALSILAELAEGVQTRQERLLMPEFAGEAIRTPFLFAFAATVLASVRLSRRDVA